MKRIGVFCGSRAGHQPLYAEAARALGRTLAERGIGLVFGGGNVGMMGAVADGALGGCGEVIGVIPRRLVDRELAHAGVTRLEVVETMHERKARMAELSAAFIALPGGLGTLDELFEQLTWAQLGIHAKPCGLLNLGGYFDDLVRMLDHFVASGFLSAGNRALLVVERDVAGLLRRLEERAERAGDGGFDRAAT